jgi:hypothetical protein
LSTVTVDQEFIATLDYLEMLQRPSGMVPWFEGGHSDIWNHCEAVIAFFLGGRIDCGLAGLEWVRQRQHRDGSFAHYYLDLGIKEPRRDLNCSIYPAVAVLVATRCLDEDWVLDRYWPMVERSLEFVIGYQDADGRFPWAVEPDGRILPGHLRTGSSSMLSSLDAAYALGRGSTELRSAIAWARELLRAVLLRSEFGESWLLDEKNDWAMDWYYPSLAGVLDVELAQTKIRYLLCHHFEPGYGMRCLGSSRWVTTAETAEFAMALSLGGSPEAARSLLNMLRPRRGDHGGYLTGVVLPSGNSFPAGEYSSYSSAAVILADYVISTGVRGSLVDALLAF